MEPESGIISFRIRFAGAHDGCFFEVSKTVGIECIDVVHLSPVVRNPCPFYVGGHQQPAVAAVAAAHAVGVQHHIPFRTGHYDGIALRHRAAAHHDARRSAGGCGLHGQQQRHQRQSHQKGDDSPCLHVASPSFPGGSMPLVPSHLSSSSGLCRTKTKFRYSFLFSFHVFQAKADLLHIERCALHAIRCP